jgi:hypothetical protein
MKHNLTIVVLLDWSTLWSFHLWRMYHTCPLPFWLLEMTILFLQLAEILCIVSWLLYICNSWFKSLVSCIPTKASLCRLIRMYKLPSFGLKSFICIHQNTARIVDLVVSGWDLMCDPNFTCDNSTYFNPINLDMYEPFCFSVQTIKSLDCKKSASECAKARSSSSRYSTSCMNFH